jgi:hypothetical protein
VAQCRKDASRLLALNQIVQFHPLKLPLKHCHLGDSIVLKVLGHHKLQDHCILARPDARAALTFQLLTIRTKNLFKSI